MELIYSGPYSRVYKQDQYAIKVIDKDFKILPHDYNREIKLLNQFNHPNIITIIDVQHKFDDIFVYMPLYSNDLLGYIRSHRVTKTRFGTNGIQFINQLNLDIPVIEAILPQIFISIQYIHQQGIIHRDIKPSNFLISGDLNTNDLQVVLCDFSVLIPLDQNDLIHDVCSGYYKPLELVFALDYGLEIDIWGLGMMVLLLYSTTGDTALANYNSTLPDQPDQQPLLEQLSDFNLIDKIFHVFGTPTITELADNKYTYWPQVFNVENFKLIKLPNIPRQSSEVLFPRCKDPQKIELFNRMCHLNPAERVKIEEITKTWQHIIEP